MNMQGETVTITTIHNGFDPRDRSVRAVKYEPGRDLGHYVDFEQVQDGFELVASINGVIVPAGPSLPQIRPGNFIVVCPKPHGLFDSTIFRVIAMIAVAVVAPQLVGVMSGLGWGAVGTTHVLTTMGSMVAGGVMIAGSMLLNAILPAATPDTPRLSNDAMNDSPTYGWGAMRQSEGQGHPIPILFGTMRVSGHTISRYVSTDGDKQYLNILLGIADVPIGPNGVQDLIILSDMRIAQQSVTLYQDVVTHTRSGGVNDAVIDGFDAVPTQTNYGQKLTYNVATEHQTFGNGVQKIELDVTAVYGLYYSNDSGGLSTRSVTFKVEYKLASSGTWLDHGDTIIEGATTQAVRKTVVITGLTAGQYDVRITRLTGESSSFREKTEIQWVAMREIVNEALIYPGLAKVAMTALATDQLSGGEPAIDVLAARNTVQVYNPDTTLWMEKDATNPAWAYYALCNTHHGIPADRMLYSEIAEWAVWCDEDVGGKPRFRVNLYMDTAADFWTQAQQVCQVGRAMPIKRGSKYGVIADMPGSVVQLFSMANITQGSFKLDYTALTDRANAVEVTYIDKDRDYTRQTVAILTSDYNSSSEPDNKTSIRVFGTTDRDQAVREGVYRLNNNLNIVRVITFTADIDALACQVGDLFYFAHDAMNWGVSGRIISATTTTATLDQPVTLEPGTTYALLVRLDDDTVLDKTLVSVAETTTTSTVTFAVALDSADVPTKFCPCAFGDVSNYKRIYRLTNISRAGDLTRKLTAVEYREEVYTDDTTILDVPVIPQTWATAYGTYAHESITYAADGTYDSKIHISWHSTTTNVGLSWEVWLEDVTSGTMHGPFSTTAMSFTVPSGLVVLSHSYKAYVTAAGRGPVEGSGNTSTVVINGKDDNPDGVDTFLVSRLPDGTREFTFGMATPPIDLAGYKIRYKLGTSASWENMTDLTKGLVTTSPYESNQLPAGDYVFAIKAVDWSGNESVNDTQVLSSLGDPRLGGVIFTAYPTGVWPGTKTNCFVDNTGWLLGTDTKTWADLSADTVTWSTWSAWSRSPNTSMTYEHPVIDVGAVVALTPLVTVVGVGTQTIEVNTSDDNIVWSGWGTPGLVSARYVKVRVTLTTAAGTLPYMSSMQILFNGQVVTEDINDIDTSALSATYRIAAGHIYIPLATDFSSVSQVMLALQSVGAGWSWEIISKTTQVNGQLAPEIKIYNSSGTLADATIDVFVRGV